jgi:anthranilate synthase/aminodeoxychorismate synthase-like glutamine amidotransferase
MIVLIDNYDSFTYNLVQYFGEMEDDIRVFRNDTITVERIRQINPDRIIISPGPCSPKEAGISCEVIRELGPEYPLLGVCLGHQAIGDVFGGDVVRASVPMHGKISMITHNGNCFFEGVDSPFVGTRYHSLVIKRDTCPECLEITAETEDGTIMAVAHRQYPIFGVQFHPESILTQSGKQMFRNFMKVVK